MASLKKSIPHIITLGNLLCGLLAIVFAFQNQIGMGLFLLALAAFLDFFDGMAARMLGVAGDLGKQLDSLADNVSFGAAPGLMLIVLAQMLSKETEISLSTEITTNLAYAAALFFPLMAALRLAIFNIDERQTTGFIGLPTPAATLFVGSFIYAGVYLPETLAARLITHPAGIPIIGFGTALLMVSPLRLMALKFKNLKWQENKWRFALLAAALILLPIFKVSAIPIIVLLYLVLSMAQNRATS